MTNLIKVDPFLIKASYTSHSFNPVEGTAMNEDTYERLKDIALYIERFRGLDPKEQSWIIELIKNGKAVLGCLALLEEIEKESLNYYELGDRLGCNWQTAKQRINALSEGGLTIISERDGRFISPLIGGRPRRLARKAGKKSTE